MVPFFRKRKTHASVKENTAQVKPANRIVSACLRWQRKWADFMQRGTERLSDSGKRIALFLFCLMAGTLSIYLVVNSLVQRRPSRLHITQLSKSTNTAETGDENTRASVVISKEDYKKIQRFRHYMDSLAGSPTGKRIYDSILIHRSGLMDSLFLIEKLYQLQNEK